MTVLTTLGVYVYRPAGSMWFFVSIKYQVWPLPKDQAALRKLAFDLQIPLVYAWTSHGLDTALLQKSIRERLRRDAPYVVLFLVVVFSIIALLVFLLASISTFPSLDSGSQSVGFTIR
jgi:hypothetical protein